MSRLAEHSHKRLTLILCCLAQFMVILDVSIVNVALPSIQGDLHFSQAQLQWVVNAYTLAFAGFLLLGGRAADLLGRRRVFVFGLGLFAFASLVGGLAQSQGMLVAARGLQGLGGAVVAPATLSILTTTFTEGAERNRALSAWGAMGGAGGAAGALLGGVLTEALSWRWILFVNVPIGLLAGMAAMRVIAESRNEGARRTFDAAGAITVTAGLVAIVYAIVRTDVNGWGSAQTWAVIGAGVVLLAVFGLIEGRLSRRPLVPLRIFRSPTLTGANIVVFLLGCAMFAMWFFASLYLQKVLGYSPIEAGLAFLPMTAAIIGGSVIAGRLTNRAGAGPMLVVGMTLAAGGLVLFARMATNGTYAADFLAPSVLVAAGLGLSFVPVTIAAMAGVQAHEAGLASGLVNTSRQVGGSLGLAILATLATEHTASLRAHETLHAALNAGYHRAFLVGAGFAAAGAVVAAVLLSHVRRRGAAAAAPARA